MHVLTVQMHLQSLHKRHSDIYSVWDCICTVYTCMNSWKEPFQTLFNPIIWPVSFVYTTMSDIGIYDERYHYIRRLSLMHTTGAISAWGCVIISFPIMFAITMSGQITLLLSDNLEYKLFWHIYPCQSDIIAHTINPP